MLLTDDLTVAYVGTMGLPPRYGGFETFVDQVTKRLAGEGVRCIVYGVSSNQGGNTVTPPNIELRTVPQLGFPTFDRIVREFWPLVDMVRSRPDIVHIMANSLLCPLWRLLGVKTIVSLDGMEWKRTSYGWLTRVIVKTSYFTAVAFSNALTVDNQALLTWAKERTDHPTALVGYGPREFEAASPKELLGFLSRLGLKEDGYFLFVGRLVPEKGVHVLVSAFSSRPKETLVVVGTDPFGGDYEELLRKMATPNIIFLGSLYGRDYELVNLAAFAQVRPSIDDSEGLPPAAIEAMGFGLAVIASDVPQNRAAFGEAAIFHDPESTENLLRAIDLLGSNPRLRAELGRLASLRASRCFSWDIWMSVLKQLYSTIAGDCRGE